MNDEKRQQLIEHPLCQECLEILGSKTPATHVAVSNIKGRMVSLCAECFHTRWEK